MSGGSETMQADSDRATDHIARFCERWGVLLALPIVALGIALHAPSLTWGFFCDDYSHQIILREVGAHPNMRPWSLFDFGGFPDATEPHYEYGAYPWWTSPDWKVRFFRPVTSLTLWLDHALFGGWTVGYHLTNLAWYAAILVLLYRLYRALALSTLPALVSLLLFTVSDSSVFPVGWPANRSTLIAVFFTVASILAISSNRAANIETSSLRDPGAPGSKRQKVKKSKGRSGVGSLHRLKTGPTPSLLGALVLALLAALAKESGVTAFALIALYLALYTPEPRARLGIALSIILAVAYVVALAWEGFGTTSIFYATPWNDTIEFLKRVAMLVSAGTLSLLGPFSLDLLFFAPQALIPAVIISLAVVIPVARIVWRYVKSHPTAGFLAGWIVLTLVPQGGAPPGDRMLFAPSVASSALLGLFLCSVQLRNKPSPRPGPDESGGKPAGRSARIVAVAILTTAGLLSGVSTIVQGFTTRHLAREVRRTILSADVGARELGQREVFVLQSSYALVTFNTLPTWAIESNDHEIRFWPMQTGRRGVRWTRIDQRTFDLESLDKPFLTDPLERVFLTARTPEPGDTFQTALFNVEVIDVDDTGLRRFRVHCRDSLDSPHYRFLVPRAGRLTAIPAPPVGESVVLRPVVPPYPFAP